MARRIPSDMVTGAEFDTNNYGRLVVVKYNSKSNVEVEFLSTGFKTSVTAGNVRSGEIRDKLKPNVYGVGFIGDGEFSPKDKYAYQRWINMLERCYSEECQAKRPTYKGCVVCDEWHNFQNFAKWYEENYPKDGGKYHLDKDLSCYGERGKLYSPETCVFVTAQVNIEEALAKSYRFLNPKGEIVDIYNLRKFCRENNLKQSGMHNVFCGKRKSYKGWTSPLRLNN